MQFNWREYLKYWYIPVICLSCVALLMLFREQHPEKIAPIITDSPADLPNKSDERPSKNVIFVDIGGAVNKPGFYQLHENDRVVDIIKIAEGLSKQAHVEFVAQKLNLSEKLHDGQKLYIPFVFDENITVLTEELVTKCSERATGSEGGGTSSTGSSDKGKIDVNLATKAELVALPGIGDVTADKIIKGRPYPTIDDFYALIKFSTNAKAALEGVLIVR